MRLVRTIGGVSFDGTGNINLPGVNATGNQDTSGNAATATQLATARTIAGVSFDGTSNISLNNNSSRMVGYITTSFTNTNQLTNGAGFISNVVEDTTPQLGGNLDLNSKNITGTGTTITNDGHINVTGVVMEYQLLVVIDYL